MDELKKKLKEIQDLLIAFINSYKERALSKISTFRNFKFKEGIQLNARIAVAVVVASILIGFFVEYGEPK